VVDTGLPRVDIKSQKAFPHVIAMFRPLAFAFLAYHLVGDTPCHHVINELVNPVDRQLNRVRKISGSVMGSKHVEHIRETRVVQPKIASGTVRPFFFQVQAIFAAVIDGLIRSGDRIKASCVNQNIKLEVLLVGFEAFLRDSLYRSRFEINQPYIVLIVDFKVICLEWDSACSETVIIGDQLFGYTGIVDTLPDFVGDPRAIFVIRGLVPIEIFEVSDPFD
jgi:hypothetical protein